MTDAASAPGGTLGRVWSVVGSVVAPATLVTAILFYFGYVSSRSQFLYFGVDVDVLGYSTQEFVMRSPQPLLVPMLLVLVVGAALVLLDAALRRRLAGSAGATTRRWVRGLVAVGATALAGGVVLVLATPMLGDWAELVTPAVLGAGAALLAYGLSWVRRHPRTAPQDAGGPEDSGDTTEEQGADRSSLRPDPGRAAVVLLVLTVVAAMFWATATVAAWSGTARAKVLARDLTDLPAVVVDTRERLAPGDDTVVETALPDGEPGELRYRYRGLRLLAEGDGALFLVPERWTEHGSTFLVPLDDVRVKFRFVNDPPSGSPST
ncbi:hypothetical protein [Isoptericola aurantiacus]|uniref:hypothetical protein n=1 Tax=Isoptericola aurantiacus TaxID=3377839 RepID=UPI00383AE094